VILTVPDAMLLCGRLALETFGTSAINSMAGKIAQLDADDPWLRLQS
jgi:hypothetical protein